MTAFAKTSSTLDELEKELHAAQASPTKHKKEVDSLAARFFELQPAVEKFVKNAKETDPDKKLYGASSAF